MSVYSTEEVLVAVQAVMRRRNIRVDDVADFNEDLTRSLRSRASLKGAPEIDLLPPMVRGSFTPLKCRVLQAVAAQVREHSVCLLSNRELGILSRSSLAAAQRTIEEARKAGLLTVERRKDRDGAALTNAVRIPPGAWLTLIQGA